MNINNTFATPAIDPKTGDIEISPSGEWVLDNLATQSIYARLFTGSTYLNLNFGLNSPVNSVASIKNATLYNQQITNSVIIPLIKEQILGSENSVTFTLDTNNRVYKTKIQAQIYNSQQQTIIEV